MEPPPLKRREKKPRKKRQGLQTISILIPDSILYNAQTDMLRSYVVGEIARAATIYRVDEIIILQDVHAARNYHSKTKAYEFFIRNLEYLETPQYLRKSLFGMHPDLKFAGLMNPLDAPHHLRADDPSEYREGVVTDRPIRTGNGSWVNIGLLQDCLTDIVVDAGTRVTIKLSADSDPHKRVFGSIVSPDEPKHAGLYWGYRVRYA
jgi:predicted SPOUT superfamily RNA methylase MTH1